MGNTHNLIKLHSLNNYDVVDESHIMIDSICSNDSINSHEYNSLVCFLKTIYTIDTIKNCEK